MLGVQGAFDLVKAVGKDAKPKDETDDNDHQDQQDYEAATPRTRRETHLRSMEGDGKKQKKSGQTINREEYRSVVYLQKLRCVPCLNLKKEKMMWF